MEVSMRIHTARLGIALFTLWLAASAFAAGSLPERQNTAKGFDANKTFHSGELDHINLFNGNLVVAIPLGQRYVVSPTLSYGLTLTWNANLWHSLEVENDDGEKRTNEIPHPRANAGLGWIVTLGRLIEPLNDPYTDPYNDTGHWIYESIDGAEHLFHANLHGGAGSEPGVEYTNDGSYLRLKAISADERSIEFPDGSVHIFRRFESNKWRLVRMQDRYPRNWVNVEYGGDASQTYWRISDSHGRVHFLRFRLVDYDAVNPWTDDKKEILTTVELAKFGGGPPATYSFQYDETTTVWRPCSHRDNFGTTTPTPLWAVVPLLRSVTLADGQSTFAMSYVGPLSPARCQPDGGYMQELTLPTKARIGWSFGNYEKPVMSTWTTEPNTFTYATGVTERRFYKAGEFQPWAKWTYENSIDGDRVQFSTNPPRQLTVKVTDPLQNVTLSYFSVEVANDGVSDPGSYGMPFTRRRSEEGRFLSTEVLSGGNVLRSTWLRYEHDAGYPGINSRVASSRTKYHDEIIRTIDSDSSDWDGHGHYRTTVVRGTGFDGISSRTTFTRYNPGLQASSTIASGAPWVLNTFDQQSISEGSRTAWSYFCFNGDTGFLKRKRSLAAQILSPHDTIETFVPDDSGNVAYQYIDGGPNDPVTLASGLCDVDPGIPVYTIRNEYLSGSLKTSSYVRPDGTSMPFRSADQTIDAATGLASASSDTAGLTTAYAYDAMGRLASVHPPGEAPLSYTYTPASVFGSSLNPAQIDVLSASANSGQMRQQYQYDSFGRLWREKHFMPDGTWSVRENTYNALGWVESTSELQQLGAEPFTAGFLTRRYFDPFGRPTRIISPDGSEVTNTYFGVAEIRRTESIATAAGQPESRVTTREHYDFLGRLVAVINDAGGALETRTDYTYDVTGGVATVTMWGGGFVQQRSFTYDRRGFLTAENHPESGVITYERDPRGHMLKKSTAAAILTFAYDAAERLVSVADGQQRLLKAFRFDRPNGANDYSLGKVDFAVRHNHHAGLGDITVRETYTYGGRGGRVSSKTTAVSGGPTFTDAYEYSEFGSISAVTYPATSSSPAAPPRTVRNAYDGLFLRNVTNYTNGIDYHSNGLLKEIRHQDQEGGSGPVYRQSVNAATGMPRPEDIQVTGFCNNLTVGAIGNRQVNSGEPAGLTVSAAGASAYQWYQRGQNGVDTMLFDQTAATLTVPVSVTSKYWVRVFNGEGCWLDSNTATVEVRSCTAPSVTIDVASTIQASDTLTATAQVSNATSYAWTITNGTILSGANTATMTFRAACSGTVELRVNVTSDCGASATATANVPIVVSAVTVSGSTTIDAGNSATISVTLNGIGPWNLTWDDNHPQNGITGSSATRTESPARTTTYRVLSASAANGCAADISGSAVITVRPRTPASLNATAVAGKIALSWSWNGTLENGDRFDVYRSSAGEPEHYVGSATSTAFDDQQNLLADRVYLYTVKAVVAGTASYASAPDVASTFVFGPNVIPNQTEIAADHVARLRAAVSALHAMTPGAQPLPFTDPGPPLGGDVKAIHILELRSYLAQARAALGLSQPVWTNAVAVDANIYAIDINELRGGVQ
jgi:YD repeat-containing protein